MHPANVACQAQSGNMAIKTIPGGGSVWSFWFGAVVPDIRPRVTHAMAWVPGRRAPGLNWINRALRHPNGKVPSSLQLQFVGFYTRPFFPAHSFIKSVHCVKPADILSFPSNIHFHRTPSTFPRSSQSTTMYKTLASTITAIAALAATATAHGSLTGVSLDGVYEQGYLIEYYYAMQQGGKVPEHLGWYAENLDNGFVEPSKFGTGDIICHKAGSPKGSSDTMGKIAAGGKIDFHWNTWPASHVGPVLTYAASYTGDIQAVKKEDLKWFKIEGVGYENGEWAAVKMIANNNTWTTTVPENLAAGKYVFRHEIIALHAAGQENGAQNYPQCVNIEVTGSGTEKPEGVVGTKLYTSTDPGIKFDVYQSKLDSYVVPGPPAMGAGSGSGSGSTPAPSKPAPSSTPSSSPSAPSPSASAPAASVTPEAQKPSPSTAPSSGNLPETFTLDTFITWLEGKASSSASKARRHARAFL